MKKLLIILFILSAFQSFAQSGDEVSIRKVLAQQVEAWNHGNVDEFMQGYWKSDSLMFIGRSGITRGWTQTLENYKKNYPDTIAMGKLSFDIMVVQKLSGNYFYVVGKFMLRRSVGDLSGYFNLLFKKFDHEWRIVADHTS